MGINGQSALSTTIPTTTSLLSLSENEINASNFSEIIIIVISILSGTLCILSIIIALMVYSNHRRYQKLTTLNEENSINQFQSVSTLSPINPAILHWNSKSSSFDNMSQTNSCNLPQIYGLNPMNMEYACGDIEHVVNKEYLHHAMPVSKKTNEEHIYQHVMEILDEPGKAGSEYEEDEYSHVTVTSDEDIGGTGGGIGEYSHSQSYVD